MGFFSGITKAVGGLVGIGGGTKVNQSATNTTKNEIKTNITNNIDTKVIADAVEAGNLKFAENTRQSNSILLWMGTILKKSEEDKKKASMADLTIRAVEEHNRIEWRNMLLKIGSAIALLTGIIVYRKFKK